VESIWELLENAIQKIQKKNYSDSDFVQLHRNVYIMVQLRHGERLYTGVKELVTQHLVSQVSSSSSSCQVLHQVDCYCLIFSSHLFIGLKCSCPHSV